jgi:hypothetical protein
LITSPCVTASHTASGPCSDSTRASQSRTAATLRAIICAIDSPSGKTAADGWACTVAQSGSLASVLSSRPVQLP